MGGKCHRNHDLSSAAGVTVRKYQFIIFNPMHFRVIFLGDKIYIFFNWVHLKFLVLEHPFFFLKVMALSKLSADN